MSLFVYVCLCECMRERSFQLFDSKLGNAHELWVALLWFITFLDMKISVSKRTILESFDSMCNGLFDGIWLIAHLSFLIIHETTWNNMKHQLFHSNSHEKTYLSVDIQLKATTKRNENDAKEIHWNCNLSFHAFYLWTEKKLSTIAVNGSWSKPVT